MSRASPLAQLSADSPLHRLDPRLRILVALAWALSCLSLTELAFQALAALLALGIAMTAGLSLPSLLRRLVLMEGFMILVLLFLPFSVPGAPFLELGPLQASQQGLEKALSILLKAHGVIFVMLALVGTLEVVALGHALAHLRVPDKLVHLFLFTVRYVQVLYDEYRRLRRAMKARGFVTGSNRHSWRSLGWLLGMLLVRSLERSVRINEAMKCRGFNGRFYLLDELRWQPRDGLTAAAALPLILALPVLESLR